PGHRVGSSWPRRRSTITLLRFVSSTVSDIVSSATNPSADLTDTHVFEPFFCASGLAFDLPLSFGTEPSAAPQFSSDQTGVRNAVHYPALGSDVYARRCAVGRVCGECRDHRGACRRRSSSGAERSEGRR